MRFRLISSLLVVILVMPVVVKAVSFQTEKDFLSAQFNCSEEQNLPGSDINSAVWLCADESGNNLLQLSRRLTSKEQVDTLQLILITDNNQAVDESYIALSKTIASKYARGNSSDIVNIIKNCQQQQNFEAEVLVVAGCIQGPVKTERHLIVRMNNNK